MAKLAINGGKPVASRGKGLIRKWPFIDQTDISHMVRVLKDAHGSFCRVGTTVSQLSLFEKEFARYHDAKYCLAVANGTVAIEIAVRALGIQPQAEVIVPSVTFIASASGILMARCIPVFADVLPETCQIDPDDVERKITSRTRAILVVHYGGYPVDMDRIKRIARKHRLYVIEDCAHAQGTAWKGRKVGAIGDIGTFSFQGSKSLASGEGGCILTNKKKLYEEAYAYHHIGRTLWAEKYEHRSVGSNYRLSTLQAALLRTQLKKLPSQTRARMATAAKIRKGIAKIPGLEPLKTDKRITQRGFYFFCLRMDEAVWGVSRGTFMNAVGAELGELGMSAGYGVPVYHLPVFKNNKFDATGFPVHRKKGYGRIFSYKKVRCPNAEKISYHEHLTINNHVLEHKGNADLYIRTFKKLYDNIDELRSYDRKLRKKRRR